MKANELRIGNWVNLNSPIMEENKIIRVSAYHIRKLQKIKDAYKPIPLTEEWLVKFGLENSNPILMYNSDGDAVYLSDFEHIEFVHQLQNLVFAIESRELTLTP
jgi:hypothetical protein